MSEYCHNCGKTISEDTKKLCAPCEAEENEPSRAFNSDAEDAKEKEERAGYRHAHDHYAGFPCPNCNRSRMVRRENGKMICEKCQWDSDRGEYDLRAVHFLS